MMSNNEEPQGNAAKLDGEAASATSASETPRARLTRLKINRFRNVKPGTELRFDDGINVLLGRNGTGKTTLLELVCAVARGNLSAYQHVSFDLEFEVRLEDYFFTISAQNTASLAYLLANSIPREQARSWKYRVEVSGLSGKMATVEASPQATRVIKPDDPTSVIDMKEAPLFQSMFYLIPILEYWTTIGIDPSMAVATLSLHLIHRNCLRLDEGIDVFRAIVEGASLPNIGLPLTLASHTKDITVFLNRYVPSEILSHTNSSLLSPDKATELTIEDTNFSVLAAIRDAIGVKSIRCSFILLHRDQGIEVTASKFGKPTFWITTQNGTTFTHDKLSYGEKRLLAFLYHAAANPQILVADELVNGMHYEWIEACLGAIQGQAFLTSQNPLLLDHLPFDSAEEVQRRFILCDRDEHGDWIWRNMDDDAADAFYRAYEVGIQHVSGILRTKGLW